MFSPLELFFETLYAKYMQERVMGYLLLVIGILVMGFGLMQVYAIFTGQIKPFTVFQDSAPKKTKSVSLQDMIANPSAATELQTAMFENVMEKQINRSVNMGATVFFYYFVMLFGFRLSSLGVQLVRPITVKLRSKVVEVDKAPAESSIHSGNK